MSDNLFPSIQESTDFIFLWWENDPHGAFVSKEYYDFLERFYRAKNVSRNWGDFLRMLGAAGAEYVMAFTTCDDITPSSEDDILEIRDGVWVLSNAEFPITQCVQETYFSHSGCFPEEQLSLTIRTEYGEDIGFYFKDKFVEMKEHLESNGYRLESRLSPFPNNIYHYHG